MNNTPTASSHGLTCNFHHPTRKYPGMLHRMRIPLSVSLLVLSDKSTNQPFITFQRPNQCSISMGISFMGRFKIAISFITYLIEKIAKLGQEAHTHICITRCPRLTNNPKRPHPLLGCGAKLPSLRFCALFKKEKFFKEKLRSALTTTRTDRTVTPIAFARRTWNCRIGHSPTAGRK